MTWGMHHPSALVEGSHEAGARIWAFAYVAASAQIGARVTIGQAAHIGPGVRIGNGCKIQNGAQLFEGVALEDEVFIGPHVVFTNVMNPRAFIDRKHKFRSTIVKRGASIGANATIRCGITIGEYALIGAGSVVTRDVGAHELWVGVPADRQGWVCKCGEIVPAPIARAAEWKPQTCEVCRG